jgi:hypothetical protein
MKTSVSKLMRESSNQDRFCDGWVRTRVIGVAKMSGRKQNMLRLGIALLILMLPACDLAQGHESLDVKDKVSKIESDIGTDLPDALSALVVTPRAPEGETSEDKLVADDSIQSHSPRPKSVEEEPYHAKGLLLQSFAFLMLQEGTRIMTANQDDRHNLLNKPFWSDYWASLQQFNMRRWNDGDSIKVNYIGHPMQGAISGYIEIQNDPRGRALKISRDNRYWKSRGRAFLWTTAYSTLFELGPMGEAGVFNEGGETYPIGCKGNDSACEATAKYTNNTGWVDFIITPIVGTLWVLGEDTIDRYVTDPLVERHPTAFGYKVMRSSLNPTRSVANMLRGRYPWYRDYEHPTEYESPVVRKFDEALSAEPVEHFDLNPHFTSITVAANTRNCVACRKTTTTGAGIGIGIRVRRYMDVTADLNGQPNVSPVPSPNIGGSLLLGNFGVRSGYSGKWFAAKVTLAPGFASYSRTQSAAGTPMGRIFNFSTLLALSGDVRFSQHLAFRTTMQQLLIRYKSTDRDPPGIGAPPWLSFLSHDNYINSTNWGVNVGPVFRF